jgi:hypothetical protein
MEIKLTDAGTFELLYDKLDVFIHLLAFGFSIALVVGVIVASIRMGWTLWPWILGLGLLAFLFV